MKHISMKHERCMRSYCVVCDGGLFICAVCFLSEGALTTDCPGAKASEEESNLIYSGRLDYREGKGWTPTPNLFNQLRRSWENTRRRMA
ncbi:hypothetical protein LCGC14_1178980 [marine sediment metagenome]|uniref:Uncharacterized protein n=1 Tax=marine sediment metagenome TaxID=412755 RepID=A0A0F9LMU7_9ZZZZ